MLPMDKQILMKEKLLSLFDWISAPIKPPAVDTSTSTTAKQSSPSPTKTGNKLSSPKSINASKEKTDQADVSVAAAAPSLEAVGGAVSANNTSRTESTPSRTDVKRSVDSDASQASTSLLSITSTKTSNKRSLTEEDDTNTDDVQTESSSKRVKVGDGDGAAKITQLSAAGSSDSVKTAAAVSEKEGSAEDSQSRAVAADVSATASNRLAGHTLYLCGRQGLTPQLLTIALHASPFPGLCCLISQEQGVSQG